MSRIFNISGNYDFVRTSSLREMQRIYLGVDVGLPEKIGFLGKMAVDGDDFCGFTEELLGLNKPREHYLYGRMFEKPDGVSMAFYRLSNERNVMPQLFVIRRVDDESSGFWSVRGIFDWLEPLGRASAQIVEVEHYHKITSELKVRNAWLNLDRSIEANAKCLERLDYLNYAVDRTLWG